MDEAEYIQIQQQLLAFAGIIEDMPLEDFIEKINLCETVAPIINPTLYLQGADKLSFIKRIAESAQEFQCNIIQCKQALKGELL